MKTVIGNVYQTLLNNATLAAYVKEFTRGSAARPHHEFPCINVGEISENVETMTIGQGGYDKHTYTVKMQCGTSNYEGDTAYYGTATIKGILDLCNDIVSVCRKNLFEISGVKAFSESFPCEINAVETVTLRYESNIVWAAEVTIRGGRRVKRST